MAKSNLAKQKRNQKRLKEKRSLIVNKNQQAIYNSRLPLVLSAKDQARIKAKAESGCNRAWQALNRTKIELEAYYKSDLPKHKDWYAANFKVELGKIDAVRGSLDEVASLIMRVKREAYYYQISDKQAYQRVTHKDYVFRNPNQVFRNPNQKSNQNQEDPDFAFGSSDDFDDPDVDQCDCDSCRRERMFNSKMNNKGSFDPDDLDAFLYTMFEEIVDEELSDEQKEQLFEQFKREARESGLYDDMLAKADLGESAQLISQRCTVLFRQLAKELHPDLREVFSTQEKEIWYQAVRAYEEKNLEKLNSTWLLFHLFCKKGISSDIAVSSFKNLQHEIKAQNNEKRREVRRLKKSSIWGFSSLDQRKVNVLKQQERQELDEQLEELAFDLQMSKQLIESWKSAPRKTTQAVSKKATPQTKARVDVSSAENDSRQQPLWSK